MSWGEIVALGAALVAIGFVIGLVAGSIGSARHDEAEPCSDYFGD